MPLVNKLYRSATRIGLNTAQTAQLAGVCRQQLYFWRIGRNEPRAERLPMLRDLAEAFALIEKDEKASEQLRKEPSRSRVKRLATQLRSRGVAGNGR